MKLKMRTFLKIDRLKTFDSINAALDEANKILKYQDDVDIVEITDLDGHVLRTLRRRRRDDN